MIAEGRLVIQREPTGPCLDPVRLVEPKPVTVAPEQSRSSIAVSIVLARHGEPALSRKFRLSSAGYRRWWATYEEGGILEGQTPPTELLDLARHADVIFASTRRRAIETAEAVAGGKLFVRDAMFIEAPLPPPPSPGFLKFNPRVWGVISRLIWWCGYHAGQESRLQAQVRAREAARRLIETAQEDRNVLVLAHGFFNRMVGLELTRMGWRSVEDRGFKYWATRRFERDHSRRG